MTRLPNGLLLERRFLAAYARDRVNLVMLVLVPVVFVIIASGAIATSARLLGGAASGGLVAQTATAGWAAGFLAAIAMYFQTRAARAADRRLVLAGLHPVRLVAARMATGLGLAVLVSAVALVALAIRAGIPDPGRVIVGTLMFAVVYLAIGAVTGALVRNPVNGMVLILFVWLVEVGFGPVIGSPDRVATRWLPTHFVALWMVDLPSRHGGRLGDLGWALAWTVGALLVAAVVVTATSRVAHAVRRRARPGSVLDQFRAGVRMGLREYRRNRVLWVLLVMVPVVLVVLPKVTTPLRFETMILPVGGRLTTLTFWFPAIHPGLMAPGAIGALAALVGLFVVLDARVGDQRLTLAGFRSGTLLAARLAVIAVAVLLVTAVTLAVAATVFHAQQWLVFAAGNVLLAATYALVGVCLGPVFGRVAGVFVAFLVPILDLIFADNPMVSPQPAAWTHLLPGYGASRLLLDGGFSTGLPDVGSMLPALAWLVGLALLATWLFRRAPATSDRPLRGG